MTNALDALLTPIALVAARSNHSPPSNHRQCFEDALLVGESTIKWAAAMASSVLAMYDAQAARQVEYELVRADGLGVWTQQLDILVKRLHRTSAPDAKALAHMLGRRVKRQDADESDLWKMRELIVPLIDRLDIQDYEEQGKKSKCLLDLYKDFVFLRNRTRGHGAKRPDYYEACSSDAMKLALGLSRAAESPLDLCAFIGADGPQTCHLLRLQGVDPQEQLVAELVGVADTNTLFFVGASGRLFQCSSLVQYRAASASYGIANGVWKESALSGEFINYASGEARTVHVPAYGGARPKLPRSHTSGESLSYALEALHNVPAAPAAYVCRRRLETRLSELLVDRVHRIVTLKGPGGSGKTSLALEVVHRLMNQPDFPFVFVAWLSARDVDLLTEGPVPRQRDVKDLPSMAARFCEVFKDSPHDVEVEFLSHVSDPDKHGSTLVIIDNFETLDDPEGVHRLLDERIILPSKLLITSRHKSYRGDFPLDVPGMERDEAVELIRREARAHHCEGSLTDKVVDLLICETEARPYPLKLAVAQLAAGASQLQTTLGKSLGRDDVLEALFQRSFELLDDDAKHLYLLAAQIGKSCPEVVLHALLEGRGHDGFAALQGALDCSLVEWEDADQHSGAKLVSVPHMARVHARRELLGYPDEREIRDDADQVRGLIDSRSSRGVVETFLRKAVELLLGHLRSGRDSERLMHLCERAAGDDAASWLLLAVELEQHVPATKSREFFKHAVQRDSSHTAVWRAWSEFEERSGDELQSAYKGIRAIEEGESDIYFCAHIAGILLHALRDPDMKERFPPHRRESVLGALRHQFEQHRKAGRLNADGMGRLGWLYLSSYSGAAGAKQAPLFDAQRCAREGLAMDPGHTYCGNLLKTVSKTLR